MSKKWILFVSLFCILYPLSACHDESDSYQGDGINEHHDIVIVGAGISGLSCGHFLGNKDFLILEKEEQVGGRTLSGIHDQFVYAKGTEYIGEPEDHLAKMISNLGLSVKEIPSPMDAYFDGNQFYYGSDGLARYLITGSSVADYKRFVNLLLTENKHYEEVPDLNYSAHVRELDQTSALQWLQNNAIPSIYIQKYNVASRGLFGASLQEISAYSFIPEAAFDYDESDLTDISSDFDIKNEYKNALAEHSESYTFVTGLTELTDRLGEQMASKIKLKSRVIDIAQEEDHYVLNYVSSSGEQKLMTANKVVLAVPAPIALDIAPTLITDRKKELLQTVSYSSYATVALFSKAPIFDKAFDLAVPDTYFFTDIYDATWVQRYYDKTTPKDYIISVYIAPQTYQDHQLDTMSDAELLSRVYADLNKVFPGSSEKITGSAIQHFKYAYPVMTLGAYERLSELMKLNKGTLILAGDYTIYPTFESAVEAGAIAAERIR